MDDEAYFTDREKRTEAWLAEHDLVGLTKDELFAAAKPAGILVRVISDDSEDASGLTALTADLRANRINVDLVDGRVSRARGVY